MLYSPTPGGNSQLCSTHFTIPLVGPGSYPWGKPMTCALHGQNYVRPKLFTSFNIANFCVTVSKEIFSNNTKHRKKNFAVPLNSSESLKRLFYKIATPEILPLVYMVLVNFEIHFLRLWLEILVGVFTDNYLHL